jgi:hypothetical protein
MRKALLLTLLALAVTGVAWAGNGPSASGGAHLVVHDVFGLQTLELQTFSFNARAGGGNFEYREIDDGAPFSASGAVTCLTVIGKDAWIGGVISKSNDPTYVGVGAWWHVTDNGEGSKAPADITTFMGAGTLAETTAFCDTHPAYKHPFPIDHGNIQVRD